MAGRPVTRRNFIVWWLAGLLGAIMVAIVAPILVYIFPPTGNSKNQQLKVKLDKSLSDLKDGQGIKFEAPKDTAFYTASGGGANAIGDPAYSAFAVKVDGKTHVWSSTCSHLGCSIQLNDGAKRFDCPCHGSEFNLDGSVLKGPAAAPLAKLNWQGTGQEITVEGLSTARTFT